MPIAAAIPLAFAGAAHAADSAGALGTVATLVFVALAVVFGALWFRARNRAALLQARVELIDTKLAQAQSSAEMLEARHIDEKSRLTAQLGQAEQREAAYVAALEAAQNDTLTKLPNRTRMIEIINRELASARRRKTRLAVMFVDIDDFKRINDTMGHTGGDELLRQAGERLVNCVRGEDSVAINRDEQGPDVARVGGDEFVLMLRDVGESAAIAAVASRLLASFREAFAVAGRSITATVSIGIAVFPRDGDSSELLLKHADMAMYRSKEVGKDGFEFFNRAMTIAASRRMTVENGLRRAIDNNEFVLHYQPKVEARSHRIVGAEALLRWNSPEHGLVSPTSFIHIAEEAGLMSRIGDWVLGEACRQLRVWQDAGLPPIHLAVNVSTVQFREDHMVVSVVKAINDSGIDAKRLQLEVTENLFMKNIESARNSLDYIRGLGVTVAIDDFGTGYSSLSYLRQFPVDALKIDRSYVAHLSSRSEDRAIVAAIIGLGRALNMRTIAEGVETRAQIDLLAELGCSEFQGHAFARPIDNATMARVLRLGNIEPGALAGTELPAAESPTELYIGGDPNATGFDAQSTTVVPVGELGNGK